VLRFNSIRKDEVREPPQKTELESGPLERVDLLIGVTDEKITQQGR